MENGEKEDIMEVKVFVDSKGHEVRQFSQVYGKDKCAPFYHGVASMRVRMRMNNGQEAVQERTVEFPFPEDAGMKKAFDMFDETAKAHMDAIIKKEQEQAAAANRIVRAGAMPKILGADGRPA